MIAVAALGLVVFPPDERLSAGAGLRTAVVSPVEDHPAGGPCRVKRALTPVPPLLQARCRPVPGTGSRPKRARRAGEQMTADSLRDRVIGACSAKPGSAEDYPLGDEVAVFRVAGKMFALVTLGPPPAASALDATRISRPGCAAGLPRSRRATTSASGGHRSVGGCDNHRGRLGPAAHAELGPVRHFFTDITTTMSRGVLSIE